LFLFGPGTGLGNSDDSLKEIVVIQVVRVKRANRGNGLPDLLISEDVLRLGEECLLVRGERLALGLLLLGLLLFLFLLGSLLLRQDEEVNVAHDANKFGLGHLKESITELD